MNVRIDESWKDEVCHALMILPNDPKYNAAYCNVPYCLYNEIMADSTQLPTYKSGLLWAKTYRILRLKVSETLQKYQLTMTEWALLGKLFESRENGVHLADIANALGVEPPLVTTMVSQLEKKGLLGRKEDIRDRRAKYIYLTDEGKALVPQIEETMQATINGLMEGLTEEEIATFLKVLSVISKNA